MAPPALARARPDPGNTKWISQSGAALSLALNAALWISLLECVHFVATAPLNFATLSYIPISLLAVAVVLGLLLAVFLLLLSGVERLVRWAPLPRSLLISGAIVPQLYVTVHLFAFRRLTGWASFALLAATLWGSVWTAYRVRRNAWLWATATLLPALASLRLLSADFSLQRAAAGRLDIYFFYVHAIALCSLVAAVAVGLILDTCRGSKAPRAIAVAAGGFGAAFCYLVLPKLPLSSDATRSYVRLLCTTLIVLGTTAVPLIRRPRWAFSVGALAAIVQLYLVKFGSLANGAGWALSRNTVLAAEAVEKSRVLKPISKKRQARLKQQPEYAQGNRILKAARAWNSDRRGAPAHDYSILLISIDALRFDAVEYSGRAKEPWTPHINQIAPRCYRFHSAYAQGGWTSISLPALLWSKYPRMIHFIPLYEDNEQGLHWKNQAPRGLWIEKRFQSPIRETDPNLPDVFGDHGYATVAVANDEFTGYFAPELGFTKHFDDIAYPKRLRDQRRDPRGREANLDEVTADVTIERLRNLGSDKFFIWTHFFSPHGPYEPPPEYDNPYDGYYGEVHFADDQVGRVLDAVRRLGRAHDTLMVITADHGESFWEHNNNTHGKELYDHAMRVPLLICLPDGGTRDIETPVGLIDIAPTLLDFVGIDIPPSMQGFSLRGLMEGTQASRPPVFIETWQNEPLSLARELNRIAVVDGHHKLILDLDWNLFSLFDLRSDPREKHNLLQEQPDQSHRRFQQLGGYLLGWRDIPHY